jgi:tetratricopeptide (TPR) repeat protein
MRGAGARISESLPSPAAFRLSRLLAGLGAIILPWVAAGCADEIPTKPQERVPYCENRIAEGWTQFQAGDFEHAIPTFEKAVKSADEVPLRQKSLYGLATMWNLRRPGQDRTLARKLYNDLLALDPKSDTAAWTMLALARMDHLLPPGEDADFDALKKLHPDYGPVREAYQKVIDAFPEHPAGHEAFMYQQCTYVTTLNPEDAAHAIAAIEAFLKGHPKTEFESALYTLLGQAHYNRGEYRGHLDAEIKALETRAIDPTNPNQDYGQLYYQVACVAEFEVGDFATARKYYQKVLDEYPVDIRGAHCRAALKRMDHVEELARAGQPFSPYDDIRTPDAPGAAGPGEKGATP